MRPLWPRRRLLTAPSWGILDQGSLDVTGLGETRPLAGPGLFFGYFFLLLARTASASCFARSVVPTGASCFAVRLSMSHCLTLLTLNGAPSSVSSLIALLMASSLLSASTIS